MQVVLKDMPDIDSNDQNSILEHLDKVVCVGFLILNENSFFYAVYFVVAFLLLISVGGEDHLGFFPQKLQGPMVWLYT